jgi:hypothetical protein
MRLLITVVIVSVLLMMACGARSESSSESTLPNTLTIGMSEGEAIALVQKELRKLCTPDSDFIQRPNWFTASKDKSGTFYSVIWGNQGLWLVYENEAVEAIMPGASPCK